jgi:hypothetical protein
VVRVVLYDRTCVVTRGSLTPIWAAGTRLYRARGHIDAQRGVTSWTDALAYLATLPAPITELQYWGHGKWGRALVADDALDASSIAAGRLAALRAQLAPGALLWFRTCETFGAAPGIDFAERLADYLGARVAGHTYIIGFHQSGLHGLLPGTRAHWSPIEGLAEGSPDAPSRAHWSHRRAPRTITCLTSTIPEPWFAQNTNG